MPNSSTLTPKQLGRDEVPEFVNHDEDDEDAKERQDC